MNTPKYVVVDLETTGNSYAKGARIIQLAMVTIEDDAIRDTYSAFVNPGQPIPGFIRDLTNITDEDVADAKRFSYHAEEVYRRLEDAVFIAHNTDFDLSFLRAELRNAGFPSWQGLAIDTVELSRLIYPSAFSYKLQDISGELGIPLENAHRADDDALATARLFLQAKKDLMELPYETLALLHKRSFGLKCDLSSLLFELTTKKRTASHSRNYPSFKGIPLAPVKLLETMQPNRFEKMTDPFERLRMAVPNFEYRESQAELLETIRHSLAEKQETVIEASTGMGKTIAYLLPAAEHALLTGKRVVISTYTTYLQDQLVQKEGIIASEIIGFPLRIALIKGMNHYIDLTRLHELLQTEDESYDETFTLMQVLVWIASTRTGDVNELNTSSGGQYIIDKIRRSHLRQLTQDERGLDFYERARHNAEQAHIVVTNHSFLLHGGAADGETALIIDEAHQLIQSAIARQEKEFVYTQWKYIFGQLGTFDEQQLFAKLYNVVSEAGVASLPEFITLESLYLRVTTLFDELFNQLAGQFALAFNNRRQHKCAALLHSISYSEEGFRQLLKYLNEWIDRSRQLLKKTEELTEIPIEGRAVLKDWHYWTEEITARTIELGEIFVFAPHGEVSWIEGDMRSLPNSLSVFRRPINVADKIEKVFNEVRGKNAIIYLSGTMSVPTDEHFITRQLGIPDSVPIRKFHPESGFYTGARVFVVEDMPEIQAVPQSEYIISVADAVTQTVIGTEGRCFVLFTSQDMLRKTVELIQDSGVLEDYMLLAQGVTAGSRMRLLKSFQRFKKSVLFGTNSFWEGVDVPGDALRAVVVVRLPFTSPDEPIFKAKSERLAAEGKNPFLHHALPEAVLRLRQGFGRLIRSKEDQGLFIVLDRRIETKSYGKEFLDALPNVPVTKVSLEKMVTAIEDWYNEDD